MVDTKKFIGNNILVVKTSDGLKSFISVDDCRGLLKELEQCYSEIADKEKIISEFMNPTECSWCGERKKGELVVMKAIHESCYNGIIDGEGLMDYEEDEE